MHVKVTDDRRPTLRVRFFRALIVLQLAAQIVGAFVGQLIVVVYAVDVWFFVARFGKLMGVLLYLPALVLMSPCISLLPWLDTWARHKPMLSILLWLWAIGIACIVVGTSARKAIDWLVDSRP